jgi:hypothetical protein
MSNVAGVVMQCIYVHADAITRKTLIMLISANQEGNIGN